MEQEVNKNETIRKMKNGSGIIAAVCLISACVYVVSVITQFNIMNNDSFDLANRWSLIRNMFTYGMNSCIMFLAFAVFFRISKNGCPFIPSNILIVRAIGVLLILSGILSAVIPAVMTGYKGFLMGMISPSGIASGMLVIFISYIMHYASLLQVESDETL